MPRSWHGSPGPCTRGSPRTYVFDETQTLDGKDAYLYRVENGRYRFVGSAPKTAA